MISDVLFDVAEEIHNYQKDMPELYGGYAQAIDAVSEVMECLRELLDTPPLPSLDAAHRQLEAAIAQLDLTRLRAARQQMREALRSAGILGEPADSRCEVQ